MDDEEDACYLLPRPAKRKKGSNFDQCIICQEVNKKVVRNAQASSIDKLIYAMEVRQDDVYHRLSSDLSTLKDQTIV